MCHRTDRIGPRSRWLIRHRVVALVVIVVLLGAGMFAERVRPTGFLPPLDEGAFVIDFATPAGTSLEETDRITRTIDDVLRRCPRCVAFTRRTGTELGPATATLQSTGDIMVRLVPRAKRGDILDVIEKVRAAVARSSARGAPRVRPGPAGRPRRSRRQSRSQSRSKSSATMRVRSTTTRARQARSSASSTSSSTCSTAAMD